MIKRSKSNGRKQLETLSTELTITSVIMKKSDSEVWSNDVIEMEFQSAEGLTFKQ